MCDKVIIIECIVVPIFALNSSVSHRKFQDTKTIARLNINAAIPQKLVLCQVVAIVPQVC